MSLGRLLVTAKVKARVAGHVQLGVHQEPRVHPFRLGAPARPGAWCCSSPGAGLCNSPC